MRALVSTAWHLVRRRAVADRAVLLAAAVTILLATTLLAAGPQYAAAVAESGLRERLATEPGDEIGIEVVLRAEAERLDDFDALVLARLENTLGPWLERTELVAESDSLHGGPLPERHVSALAVATHLEQEGRLVAGRWPSSSGDGPVPAVLLESAASFLGLEVGDEVVLLGRDDREVPIAVVGIYVPDNLDERIWWRSSLLTEGVVDGTSFSYVGPFVTDEAGLRRLGDYRSTMRWRSLPDAAAVTAPDIASLRRQLVRLDASIHDLERAGAIDLRSGLRDILTDAVSTLRATQAAVIVTTIQLAVLALYALGLAAALLVDGRLVETELVRARGAEPRQLGAVAAAEGLLLVVPAVLLAPWLASLVVRFLATTGVLAEIGLTLAPRIDVSSYVGAAIAGLASVVVLVIPAVRSARTFTGTRAARGRTTRAPFAQRTGLDLALLVVAVLGLWQLRRLGGPVQADAAGRVGIDPLLVAAPALGLLAGAVLTLRFVPLAGRIAETLVVRARSLVPVLGAWQLARRPGRLARSVLLLVLAVAIGTFAATYGGTWSQSQADQASLAVGADLVVTPDTRARARLGPAHLRDAYLQIDGVEGVSPMSVDRFALPRNAGSALLVGIDGRTGVDVLTVRDDLIPGVPADTVASLVAPVDLTGIDLAGDRPEAITATIGITEIEGSVPGDVVGLQLIVRDGTGLVHRVGPIDVPVGVATHMQAPLGVDSDGLAANLTGPVRLLGMDVRVRPAAAVLDDFGLPTIPPVDVVFEVSVSELAVDGRTIAFSEVDWSAPAPTASSPALSAPEIQRLQVAPDGFTLRAAPGYNLTGSGLVTYRLAPEQPQATGTIPVLATPAYVEAIGADVGSSAQIRLSGALLHVEVVGVVDVVPGYPEESVALLADIATLASHRYRADRDATVPQRWLLATDAMTHEGVAQDVAAAPFNSVSIIDRAEITRSLRTDPVAIGLIGALTLGFGAAAAFAAVGYLVSAVVAARERLGEFALLRALGTSHVETRRWLTLESGSTVLVSLGGGVALGLGLAWVILPSVSLARDGGVAIPAPVVVIPWLTITFVAAGAAVVLFAVPALVTRMLGRTRVAEVLRLGDEG